ncbi:hypothetical protein [Jiella sonneratiae]|uniref:Uncharacterized protein n=1 Tax=Jiella sonneratiae TaxID=2816856 RepID=A0ABS3JBD2_9HYPH|nr:hypothetical protein [Jiella sonneratiae]MBO0906278.1 hypothetical protein [Jiella sonneratiae]
MPAPRQHERASPPRAGRSPAERPPSRSRWRGLAGTALVLGCIALGAAFAGATPDKLLAALQTGLGLAGGDPGLSAQAAQARTDAFDAARPFALAPLSAAEAAAALPYLGLSAGAAAALKTDLDKGAVRLVALTLWDDQEEDGDVVRVETAGYGRDIPLAAAPTRIVLPVDGDNSIRVRGTADGGGGITMAIAVNGKAVPLPPLAVGETVSLPIG